MHYKQNTTVMFYFALTIFIDLSEPVDVYSDWIDACEAANQ